MKEMNIDSNFSSFFYKEIVPYVNILEKKRKTALILCCAGPILFFSMPASMFLFSMTPALAPLLFIMSCLSPVIMICVMVCIVTGIFKCSGYKKTAKKQILPKILKYIGDFSIVPPVEYREGRYFEKYVFDLELFPHFTRFEVDDYLRGKHNDIDMDIVDLRLQTVHRTSKGSSTNTVFGGILVTFPSPKKYEGKIIIKDNVLLKVFKNRKRVDFGDNDFEKMFDVYADNSQEARTLVTPSLMTKLIQLKKRGIRITISYEYDNVNIAIKTTGKDWFDIPLTKRADNIESYMEIVNQLKSVCEISDLINEQLKV